MGLNNSFKKRLVRNLFYEEVEPRPGSLLYVKLIGISGTVLGTPEHTGVYLGQNQIAEVYGDGYIRVVDLKGFLDYSSFIRMGLVAYVLTDTDGRVLAHPYIATRARQKVGTSIDYHLLLNNCHMFTSYCLTGDEHNTDSTFFELEMAIRNYYGVDIDWRVCVDL